MRKLTKRERKLAILVGVVVFLVANLIGVTALLRKQEEFQTNLELLRTERSEADSWLAQKETWQKRKEWLDKNQPRLKSEGEANAELLEALTTSAARHSITIVDQGFAEPDSHDTTYQQIAVKLKISGSLESITRWLVETQQPANFQGISSLTMKIDSDPSKITCELTVARYYARAE
jgi:hypothetical protein